MKPIANNRYLIARRLVQVSVLLLFVLGYRLDWQILGRELVEGNLSASRILGAIPLADPFAALQIWLTGHALLWDTVLGALIVATFYLVIGGRVFCSWVCPVNLVADTAAKLRTGLGVTGGLTFSRRVRYVVLALALVLSLLTGVAAFEWISPIAMLHRELIYGLQLGWVAVLGIFVYDLLVQKHGWCGHLCPLGAFYSLLGRFSLLRIAFVPEDCTSCGDCHRVCPEPQVLNLRRIAETWMVLSGNCTNCGRCITQCPEDCLSFGLRKFRKIPEFPQAGAAFGGKVAALADKKISQIG